MFSAEASSSHTNWQMIYDAATVTDLPKARTAMEKLVRRYWPAVYAFIRSSGRNPHDAADLTQGFVCDVILGRGLISHADPQRGRFRSLLLSSLQNYLREQHRYETRAKRNAGAPMLQLSEAELSAVDPASSRTPEEAFREEWKATLIRRVLEQVRESCRAAGLDAHWEVFEARVVRPMLFGEERVSYEKLVTRLDLDDAAQAANMMITIKRRFVKALIAEVSSTVSDPMQTEPELRELLGKLER